MSDLCQCRNGSNFMLDVKSINARYAFVLNMLHKPWWFLSIVLYGQNTTPTHHMDTPIHASCTHENSLSTVYKL